MAAALAVPAAAHAGQVRAGVGVEDATWHVGAAAGQYAGDCADFDPERCSALGAHGGVDPNAHAYRRAPSYGVQSRLSARAIVVEGADGERLAVVKNDLYIPQDMLWRRTAQILEERGTGIGHDNLTMAVTHNHSSPYYSSLSWGLFAFQDVFDIRFFEYYARQQADAVEEAVDNLVPVRVGASVNQFDKTHRHSFGPAIADDGTPAGYPVSETDHDLTVIRFDDISDPKRPRPLANLVNFSLHPEFLEGNDLNSGDYVAPLERMVDRETGALTIWTQGAVGTSEPERSTYHSIHERLEFTHRDYAQAEYGARLMADSILGAWRDVAAGSRSGRAAQPDSFVPFKTDFPVAIEDRWYPGPISHPYPGVSNCRTDKALAGDPHLPIVGLPDCSGGLAARENACGFAAGLPGGAEFCAAWAGIDTDTVQALGIPVPENYSAPASTGLEETLGVHLQAFRLGDILFTVCSCEQWYDQSQNIETRTDTVAGNEHLGYDWKERCTQRGDGTYGDGPDGYGTGTWDCPNPGNPAQTLPPLSDKLVQRMHAQVTNPANGWNTPEYAPYAESEPTNLREIKGNYTHDDDARSAAAGYTLTVPISMANDYNGYIATYREYQRGDHYRKALTGWGAHSSDYMATRMVALGRAMNGFTETLEQTDAEDAVAGAKTPADQAAQDAKTLAVGNAATAVVEAYEAVLPADGGEPGAVAQPTDIERFDATSFTWLGGSNWTDDPQVVVERRRGNGWVEFADMSGEVPVTLEYPAQDELPAYLTGGQEWRWTAHFEAFGSTFDTGGPGGDVTPAGDYRFRVTGRHRAGQGAGEDYEVVSDTFRVLDWDGITAEDVRVEPDGRVSFRVGPRSTRTVPGNGGALQELRAEIGPIDYPDGYDHAWKAKFVRLEHTAYRDPAAPNDASQLEWFCFTCSFRPWADTGDAQSAALRFVAADGTTETVAAAPEGGRWVSARPLADGESAYVGAGCVRDRWGDFNGAPSAAVGADPAVSRSAGC